MHGDAAVILRAALRLAPADVKTQVMEKAVKAMAEAMNLEATVEKVSFGSESKAEAFDWSADYSIDHLVDTTSTASESSALLRIPEWLGRFPAADELPFTPDGQLRLLGPGTFQVHAKIGLPPDWTLVPPAPSASSVDFADYRASYLLEGHALILERTLSFRALALPEARGADYEALRSQLSREPRVLSVERHRSDTKPAPAAASEAQALVKAAVAECHDHDYESCAAKLRRAVELVPDHKSAWNELGRAYLAKRETDRALAALQKQIEIVPAHLYAYNNLGLALRQAHRDVEAEAAFRKQLEINPEDRFAHRNLAYLLSATKRYRDAVPEFEMAAAIEPKSATLEVGLGTAYLGEGEDDKALAAFEKALELAPGAFVWNSAAYALAEASKHLDRAEKWARSAIAAVAAELSSVPAERLAPADENASYRLAEDWDTLGWVYFRRGLDGDALRYLAAAFGLRPTSIGADHLGQVYEHAGDKSKALHAYALAVSISSDFAEARQRLDTLAGGESEAVSILTEARADLPQLSSLRIGRPSGLKGELSQDLLVALGSNLRILAAETTTPLPRNEALARALVGVEHGLQFPDPAPPRVVRRARLVCPREGDCRLSYPQESQGPPVISGVGANTQAGAPPAAGVGGKVEPPRKIKNVNPVYPETAKQAGIEGKVVLQCTVRTDGTVAEVKVVNSIPELDDAAVAAVRGWVYEPARLKGVAMPVVMTVTVNFQLNSP
jgi:TonB family protein